MEFSIKSGNPEKQRSACVVVGVFEPRKLTLAAELIDNAARSHLSDIIRRGDMEGKAGTTLLLHNVPGTLSDRVLLVGLGKEKEFGDREYCDAIRCAVRTLNETGSFDGTVFLTETNVRKRSTAWRVRQAALVAQQTVYRFDQFKSKKDKVRRPLRKLTFIVDRRNELAAAEEALSQGQAIAEGMSLAKDLANLPGNVCTPSHLAETAHKLAAEHKLECQVLEREEMAALGMHSLLSVAQSSHQPPKLIVLHYKGGKSDEKPVVLVGKGVTFDTGGISIKPAAGMDEMKYDMCGAASVFGAIEASARLGLPIDLIGIVPAVENMPDGDASRPGDVVTSMSGITVEILNTDAEGRLILCDALTYARRFEPESVIDIATLTGACIVALGKHASGLMTKHDDLAEELLAAGTEVHDRAWRLPLWDDYQVQLETGFADVANIGGKNAGAITAGCFLARFTEGLRWAHLDVAGSASDEGRKGGATGRPLPLLMQWLMQKVA